MAHSHLNMDDTTASTVFQRANQSVDDFLKEIQANTTDPVDISLPELHSQQQPGSPSTLPLNVDNPILPMELNGPREFVDSPKKRVTIDVNPPVEMEFHQLSEYEGDESNSDQSLDQLKSIWEKVDHKPRAKWDDTKYNPLPRITNSASMPNLEVDFDSEQTMVPSPLPPKRKAAPVSPNKVTYDHSHYIQDMESAKYQKYSQEKEDLNKLKCDIANLPDLKPLGEVKKQELVEGFQDQNDVKRSDSLKSIISIKETTLETKTVKRSMVSVEVDNAKFSQDDEIVDRAFNEVNAANAANDLDVSDTDIEPVLNVPKHQHKRSSSLSDMVGNFIRSISSKSISAQHCEDRSEPFTKPPAPGSRIVSGVSVATTNTEGFVSAQEDINLSDIDQQTGMQDELKNIVDMTDEADADLTIVSNEQRHENSEASKAATVPAVPADEDDFSLNKEDKVDMKKLNIESPNSSFNSDKFILKTPFDDGVYTNEFEDFNKSLNFKSRISSTSTTTNPKRIESFELSERRDVLNIWSTQSPNATSPVAINEFDPIKSPIKASIISSQKAREIRKIKESSQRRTSRTPSEDLIPSKWVLKKLEFIPGTLIPASHSKSNSIHTIEKLIVNPVFNSNEGLEHYNQLDDVDVSNGTIIHNDDYLAIKFDDSLVNERSALLNAELSTGLSDMEDSLLKIINKWDPVDTKEGQTSVASSKQILNQVWNASEETTHVKTHINHLSEDFEGYIQQKRIISDEFKVKSAQTGKVRYHTINSSPVEQNGTIYHLENLSYSNLIPELGITQLPSSSVAVEQAADVSLDSFKTANSKLLLTPKKQTMADTMRPQLSPQKVDEIKLSPAHRKMQQKMQQQMEMKREQKKHQRLQSQLKESLREEAKILAEMYPKRAKSIKVVRQHPEEPQDEMFEEFTAPLNDNPFESPSKSPFKGPTEAGVEPSDKKIVELKSKLVDGERGRLFFRVKELKDIKLPPVTGRNCKFQMVLDNGIHRLVTDFIDLKSNKFVTIDKEFELIVADRLDIIITLRVKYDRPQPQRYTVAEKKMVKSKSKIGRLFGRKEVHIVNKEVVKQPPHDALGDWVANDGSFGKLKVSFEEFENKILGRPSEFTLKCYNEWKVYTDTKGKQMQISSPVEACTIDCKMLFIPRTTQGEVLPISISNALDQVNEVNKVYNVKNEGFMYQEGGDLETWTRRYYKLDGFDLLAFSDLNGKLKSKINLKKIHGIVSGSATTSRKFSDSLKLNNGFKIVFSNEEMIEFGCDSKQQMDQWLVILNQLIALNNFQKQPWLKLMVQNTASI